MKKLLAFMLLLLCAAPLLLARVEEANDLHLQITLTKGERSRDSNSATTLIIIRGETLIYRKTYGGKLHGRPPETRELTLTGAEQQQLVKLIKERKLLRTDSIEREQADAGIYLYFELSIKAVVNRQEGLIRLKGNRKASALKGEMLYKDAVVLLEEIYGIIHRADENISYEPLIY